MLEAKDHARTPTARDRAETIAASVGPSQPTASTQAAPVRKRNGAYVALGHGAAVFAASVVVNAGNYAYHYFAVRTLGVEAYGALSSLIAVIAIVSVPATILMTIVAKCTAEHQARGDETQIAHLQRAVAKIALALTAVVAAAGVLGQSRFAAFLHLDSPRAIAAATAAVAAALLLPIVRGVLQGRQRFAALAVSFVVEAAGKLLVGLWLMKSGFGVFGAVAGIAVGSALALLTHAPQYLAMTLRAREGAKGARAALETGGGVALTTVCLTILGSFDLIFVRHFLGAHEAGLYSAISLIGRVFLFGVAFIPTVMLPKAAARAAAGASPRSVLGVASAAALAISSLEVGVVIAYPAPLLRLLAGGSYDDGARFMLPYCVSSIFLGFLTLATTYKIGIHRFDFAPALVVCTVAEVAAMAYLHGSVAQIIGVLLVGHAAALTTALLNIATPSPKFARTPPEEDAAHETESRARYV